MVSLGNSTECTLAAGRSPNRAGARASHDDVDSETSSVFVARLGNEAEILYQRRKADWQVNFHLLPSRHLLFCLQECSAAKVTGEQNSLDTWALGQLIEARAGPTEHEVAYRARLEAYARIAGSSLASAKQLAKSWHCSSAQTRGQVHRREARRQAPLSGSCPPPSA